MAREWQKLSMKQWVSRQWRNAREVLRWRGARYLLILGFREILRPILYWHVWYIFDRDLRQQLPEPDARENFESRIYSGKNALENAGLVNSCLAEYIPADSSSRLERGDALAVTYAGTEPVGVSWMTFSSGLELAFGAAWKIQRGEAVQYDAFVHPRWRGHAIQSVLNVAMYRYARDHGIDHVLASVSVFNSQSLALAKRRKKSKSMTVFLLRVRGINWVFAKAGGARFESRFLKSPRK
jgi:GNAT superfamily N-acetyltransferase